MATNAKVNTYAEGDSDLTNIMIVLDRTRIGFMQVSLTEMDTTTIPEVAAGSLLEVAGALYSIASDEAISTTDPVTETTVADGTVYIMAIPDGNDITFALTATAPTWSDTKQGWYGTGDYILHRYVGGCWIKKGTGYYGKFLYRGYWLVRNSFIYTSEELTDEFTGSSGSSFETLIIPLVCEEIECILYTDIKVTGSSGWAAPGFNDDMYKIYEKSVFTNSTTYVETITKILIRPKTGFLGGFSFTLNASNNYSETTYIKDRYYQLIFGKLVN